MANYRGHVAGAATFAVFYLSALSLGFGIDLLAERAIFSGYYFPIALTGLVVLFGIWPDIDINSRAQNLFYSIFFLIDVVLILSSEYEAAAYLGLLAMLPVISKHRGWTHSKLAVILVPSPFLIIPYLDNPGDPWVGLPYYLAAVVGYVSHLYFDGLIIKRKRKKRR